MFYSSGYSVYAAAGSLDPTFGTGGKVAFGSPVIPSTVLLQSTGKIDVVAGFDNTAMATESFGVVRDRPNGLLDTSFGGQGVSLAASTNFINSPNSAGVQPDDKIVVAGEAHSADGTTRGVAVSRLYADSVHDYCIGNGREGPAEIVVV